MSKTINITRLDLSWSTSRGADTYGYNIARLDDSKSSRRFRCMGGGYDMIGTVFGEWLEANYQERLLTIASRAKNFWDTDTGSRGDVSNCTALYGMQARHKNGQPYKITLDGACGIESMIRIAEAIGLDVQRTHNRKGQTTGYLVSEEA